MFGRRGLLGRPPFFLRAPIGTLVFDDSVNGTAAEDVPSKSGRSVILGSRFNLGVDRGVTELVDSTVSTGCMMGIEDPKVICRRPGGLVLSVVGVMVGVDSSSDSTSLNMAPLVALLLGNPAPLVGMVKPGK